MRAGFDIDPFPPPGLTNVLTGEAVPSLVNETVGETVDTEGDEVEILSGQSFVHIAISLQYVDPGPYEW